MTNRIRTIFVAACITLLPTLALAGPPLLCFPMSIGNAPSLPWGTGGGWNTPTASYDRTRLVDDTLAVLAPSTPVLVRMETLRRATIYASPDAATAGRLIDALRLRARNPDDTRTDALAIFDLGYAVEASRQTQHGLRSTFTAPADDGYALVRKALARRPADPAMQYAAALISTDRAFRGASDEHLQAALAAAPANSDLGRTIAVHRDLWGGRLTPGPASARR